MPNLPVARDADRVLSTLRQLLAIEAIEIPAVLDQASDLLASAVGADKIDAWLYEAATHSLVAAGSSATPMAARQRQLGLDRLPIVNGGRTVAVFRTGRPYTTGALDTDTGEIPGLAAGLGARSKATFAFTVGDRRGGVLEALSAQPDHFSVADLAFLELVAAWVGVLVHRATVIAAQTVALSTANAALVAEVAARREVEAALRTANAELQRLSRQLLSVQERERRQLARELHDEIGQTLTGLKFLLDAAEHATGPGLPGPAREAQQIVSDLLARVSDLSLNLRPAILDDLGLLPALLWFVARYQSLTGITVTFRHYGVDARFVPDVETGVYRLVQEALTNIARHAQAPTATVVVFADTDCITVQIEDPGRGFDPAAALAAHASSGLRGMQERVGLLGGTFDIESTPGVGTQLQIELPLDRAGLTA